MCTDGKCIKSECSSGDRKCSDNIIMICRDGLWIEEGNCSSIGRVCSNGKCEVPLDKNIKSARFGRKYVNNDRFLMFQDIFFPEGRDIGKKAVLFSTGYCNQGLISKEFTLDESYGADIDFSGFIECSSYRLKGGLEGDIMTGSYNLKYLECGNDAVFSIDGYFTFSNEGDIPTSPVITNVTKTFNYIDLISLTVNQPVDLYSLNINVYSEGLLFQSETIYEGGIIKLIPSDMIPINKDIIINVAGTKNLIGKEFFNSISFNQPKTFSTVEDLTFSEKFPHGAVVPNGDVRDGVLIIQYNIYDSIYSLISIGVRDAGRFIVRARQESEEKYWHGKTKIILVTDNTIVGVADMQPSEEFQEYSITAIGMNNYYILIVKTQETLCPSYPPFINPYGNIYIDEIKVE